MSPQVAAAIIGQWGPALVVCLVVVLGFFYQNSRTNDTNSRIADTNSRIADTNARIADTNARIAQLASNMTIALAELRNEMKMMEDRLTRLIDTRINDMRDLVKSEVKRLDEKIDQSNRLVTK